MIYRPFWIDLIKKSWDSRSVVWLSGVRRSGKTSLAKMFPGLSYLNCDLPSVVRQLDDPEFFYRNQPTDSMLIFDEIHRLKDPSLVLKIGADEFPGLKILATGSSTLAATHKFRDSLTGRKMNIYLPPVLWSECKDYFHIVELDRRLLHGGLPEFLLMEKRNQSLYAEWIDSYYARDILELFRVRNREGFLGLMKFLFMQSAGILDITNVARACSLSRPTVITHIESLAVAHAIFMVSPFFGGGKKEIVKQPKIYAFDTGFVCFLKGWNDIRDSDRGLLWEHLVLDMLRVKYRKVQYWQDKGNFEIDFIVTDDEGNIHAIECKINPDKFSANALYKFRQYYPEGKNYCCSPHIKTPYVLQFNGLTVEFLSSF
jgi:predicted AAA+ superfamily ATPase